MINRCHSVRWCGWFSSWFWRNHLTVYLVLYLNPSLHKGVGCLDCAVPLTGNHVIGLKRTTNWSFLQSVVLILALNKQTHCNWYQAGNAWWILGFQRVIFLFILLGYQLLTSCIADFEYLFRDYLTRSVNNSDYIALNDCRLMNLELKRIWKEAALTLLKAQFRHLHGGTDENH